MGVRGDLVLAKEGDAEKIGTCQNIFEQYAVITTKQLDPVTLDTLFSIIDHGSDILKTWYTPLYERDDWLWIFQLPDYFVDRMASLSELEGKTIAEAWLETGELWCLHKSSQEDLEFVIELFSDMCETAQQALKWNMKIYLRVTL